MATVFTSPEEEIAFRFSEATMIQPPYGAKPCVNVFQPLAQQLVHLPLSRR
jgi:hypothetical protein